MFEVPFLTLFYFPIFFPFKNSVIHSLFFSPSLQKDWMSVLCICIRRCRPALDRSRPGNAAAATPLVTAGRRYQTAHWNTCTIASIVTIRDWTCA